MNGDTQIMRFVPQRILRELRELDEEKAKKNAILAGFKRIGLIGVLIIAKQMGLIKNIKSVLEHLPKENFRLSNKIVNEALKRAEE